MPSLDTLAQMLNDSLTRAERDPDSRNRPISLYLTVNDSITADASALTLTATTGPFVWHNGTTGPPRLYWGLGEWVTP